MERLFDSAADVRRAAVYALRSKDSKTVPNVARAVAGLEAELVVADKKYREKVFRAIKHVGGPDALRVLLEELRRGEGDDALRSLRGVAALASVPTLVAALDTDDSRFKRKVLDVLSGVRSLEVMRAIAKELEGEDEEVVSTAAFSLGKLGFPEAVPFLKTALRKATSHSLQDAVLGALITFDNPDVVPALVEFIDGYLDGSIQPPVQERHAEQAVVSLAQYPPERSIEILARILSREATGESEIRRSLDGSATKALIGIRHPRAFDLLVAQLESPSVGIRALAIDALGAQRERRALPVLVELLRDPHEDIQERAKAAIDAIRYYLELRALANAAEKPEAMTELVQMLDDANAMVRIAAVRALARLPSQAVLAVLVRHRRDTDPAVREAIDAALDALSADLREQ